MGDFQQTIFDDQKVSQSVRDQIPLNPHENPMTSEFLMVFRPWNPHDFPIKIPKHFGCLERAKAAGSSATGMASFARVRLTRNGDFTRKWWFDWGISPSKMPLFDVLFAKPLSGEEGDSDRKKTGNHGVKKVKAARKETVRHLELACTWLPWSLPNKPTHWPHNNPMSILQARWLWNYLTNIFLDWVTPPTKYGGRAKKNPKNIWSWQMRILQCTFSRSRFHFPNNQMTESIHISFTTLRPWSEVAVWARCAPTGRVAADGSRWMAAFVPQIKLGKRTKFWSKKPFVSFFNGYLECLGRCLYVLNDFSVSLVGGFKHVIFNPIWADDPNWRSVQSYSGLVQPLSNETSVRQTLVQPTQAGVDMIISLLMYCCCFAITSGNIPWHGSTNRNAKDINRWTDPHEYLRAKKRFVVRSHLQPAPVFPLLCSVCKTSQTRIILKHCA